MLEDHVGQVLKLKIHQVFEDHYDVRDVKNNAYELLKRYTYGKKIAQNSFVKLHVLKERDGRVVLSTKIPILKIAEIGALEIKDVSTSGYFLDNGYEQDVFLPKENAPARMNKGEQAVVMIEQGRENLLKATMTFDKVKINTGLKVGSTVNARVIQKVYAKTDSMRGIQVITDKGVVIFVNRDEMIRIPHINEIVPVRILSIGIKDELEGTLKEHVKSRNKSDIETLQNYLIANNGVITLTEKSAPEEIQRELDMSKKAFKKAISGLLNKGEIEFKNHKIYAVQSDRDR